MAKVVETGLSQPNIYNSLLKVLVHSEVRQMTAKCIGENQIVRITPCASR